MPDPKNIPPEVRDHQRLIADALREIPHRSETASIADELRALREEISALRSELSAPNSVILTGAEVRAVMNAIAQAEGEQPI